MAVPEPRVGELTVTPAQMAAPVQLEALPVAVRRAVGESVARQEIWSPRAALGQSLRLVQLLTLRTLLCSRGGHADISRIQKNKCIKKKKKKRKPPCSFRRGSTTTSRSRCSLVHVTSGSVSSGRRTEKTTSPEPLTQTAKTAPAESRKASICEEKWSSQSLPWS